jgi:hypothetical protein
MSNSHQESKDKDIKRDHTVQQTASSSSSAQHDYSNEDQHAREEAFFSEEDEDIILPEEEIGLRTVGRKGKGKHARGARGANYTHDLGYGDESDSSDQSDIPESLVVKLPPEVLSRVFAHLDPTTLNHCSNVCRAFARVARDEATWRLAFAIAFRVEKSDLPTTPIIRRVDVGSWKAEYTKRTDLVR